MKSSYDPEHITYFAETDFRNQQTRFGIKSRDRTRHMYVIGKSGVGKSTMLENMAIQDISHGEGVAVLDPHGSFAEKMLDYIPNERIKDVIYLAPFDTNYPISFNVLEDVGADKRHFVASGLMSTFKKIWVDAWSARMEYILNNILLALLEYPGATLLGVNRMLSDKVFRNKVVATCTDPGVKAFWVEEFAKYGERYMQEAGAAIQNKIGQFTANPLIRNIIGQPKSSFDIRTAMDEQKILIINLSKGRIGEQNTSLLGSMIITKIYLAAMSRADATPERMSQLPNFYFYVDEFQSFANESFANILSEARKYKLALIIAHQYVAQMEESVRDAVFGNVGTSISFRVGPMDAELLEKVYAPQFMANDIINLGMAQIYLSLMINDMGSAPFSARTIPPFPRPTITYRNDVIEWTRESYASPKELVENNIREWYAEDADTGGGNDSGRKLRMADGSVPQQSLKPTGASAPYNPDALAKIEAAKIAPVTAPTPVSRTVQPKIYTPKPDPILKTKTPVIEHQNNEVVLPQSSVPQPVVVPTKVAPVFSKPLVRTPVTIKKPFIGVFKNTSQTMVQKPQNVVAAEMPVESSALSSLLSSLDQQASGITKPAPAITNTSTRSTAPFTGEKTLRESIPAVKVSERGPTEKNKDLLKAALQDILKTNPKPSTTPLPIKSTLPPTAAAPQQTQQTFTPRAPSPSPVESPGNEISTQALQKLLE
ncbi:type IV secretion system DNA-binding domain-containing protein [Patescibacteria group bacterium]|nr:type IV secretion system DNA-binding domain-containing protein [Patescibacteria group bacterium]